MIAGICCCMSSAISLSSRYLITVKSSMSPWSLAICWSKFSVTCTFFKKPTLARVRDVKDIWRIREMEGQFTFTDLITISYKILEIPWNMKMEQWWIKWADKNLTAGLAKSDGQVTYLWRRSWSATLKYQCESKHLNFWAEEYTFVESHHLCFVLRLTGREHRSIKLSVRGDLGSYCLTGNVARAGVM